MILLDIKSQSWEGLKMSSIWSPFHLDEKTEAQRDWPVPIQYGTVGKGVVSGIVLPRSSPGSIMSLLWPRPSDLPI